MSSTDNNDIDLFFEVEQKTDKQHILDNPDTYIGSVETVDADMWIMAETHDHNNEIHDKIVEKNISYIPGLFKLFDEGIVNCRDHVIRMKTKVDNNVENSLPVTFIDVSIQDDGSIVMINDGNGMDVVMHPKYNVWVPELIFGHLRTSTNYNKEEKKIVGGKNGFGFKLVLIWSTSGSIETVDHIRNLKYVQEFKDNLDTICPPKITKATKSKPYTKITFKPDYRRLGINGLSPDMISLLKKRVYDISAVTDKTIKVKYNSNIIPIKNFEQYINLYIGDKSTSPRVYESGGDRWEYAVAITPKHEFVQVSFVNGISTAKGGKHVEYILNQIVKKLTALIEKKKKIKVNPSSIKEQLILFLRCDIENPSFDSQTKDYMNTPASKFGSKCEVSDKFIEKVSKLGGLMEDACAITEVKEFKAVAKKTNGSKTKYVRGIPKLDDANWAGKENSHLCTLILCEGDSAKTAVISGLSSSDRNTIGVYPIGGKIMNVRGETFKKITDNKEIAEIMKILGLEIGKEYNTQDDVNSNLRYGRVSFMTDQDLDGGHIKGLGINFFHELWPSLTKIDGFIGFMNTPILKAKKGEVELSFYNQGEYENWKNSMSNELKLWKMKYYKGLGTSTKGEFKQYFKNKNFVNFGHTGEKCDNSIDMVFNKKRQDDRKNWLENVYSRDSYADTSKKIVSYEEFINKELIHFSKYDCDRSISNAMDGFKISLRKIMYSCFKRKLTSEIKVAQLAGYVSEHSCYHHGEDSLNKAIIGLAQNFVGSNNINLLRPSGQFGSRIKGGKDSASPRYIFTKLENITRCIFPEVDDHVLKYLDDDGTPVEPQFYAPIIPMVLVNGSNGIGTGFSSEILCYNPKTIISYLKNILNNESDKNAEIEFIPYYEGFKGDIIKLTDTKFLFKGKYEKLDDNRIRVTELPIGHWNYNFKELLEELLTGEDKKGHKFEPVLSEDTKDNSTDTTVDFELTFVPGKLAELEASKGDHGCNGLEKLLKLYTTNSTTNMNLFDEEDKLKKYDDVKEIIDDYYSVRLHQYDLRKDYLIDELENKLMEVRNKVNYINEVLAGTIDLRGMDDDAIVEMLEDKEYDKVNDSYDYMIKMPMNSVSNGNVAKLLKKQEEMMVELETLKNTPIEQMWLSELDTLEREYEVYLNERIMRQNEDVNEENDEENDENKPKKKPIVKKTNVKKTTTKKTSETVSKKVSKK